MEPLLGNQHILSLYLVYIRAVSEKCCCFSPLQCVFETKKSKKVLVLSRLVFFIQKKNISAQHQLSRRSCV
jgi:hypothetical protein